MISAISHQVQQLQWKACTYKLLTPAARSGSLRRCVSAGTPPPPPPPPPSSPPPLSGGSGGEGGHPGAPLTPWLLRSLQLGAGLLAATGVVLAALPSVLSTQWGLQQALALVNTRLPGRVEVAEARLSWAGGNELQCVKVYDSPRGGQILMHLNKVSTASSLWTLIAGRSGFNVVIAKPWINMVYDTRMSEFKIINFMEKVGLLSAPPPAPQPPAPEQPSKPKPQQWEGRSAAGAGPQPAQAEAPEPNAAPAAGMAAQQPQQPQQQQGGRLMEILGRINSKMDIDADVRVGRMNLVMTDGMLLVPVEVRQALGPRVHVTGALGASELRDWAAEVGEDVAWADSPAATANPATALPAGAAPVPPPAAVRQHPGRYRPGVLQVHSDHLMGEMRVWDGPDHTLLHQPATAQLELTPALARFGLATANPLLGQVVEVQGGGRLHVTFRPEGGRLPYQEATLEMAPVDLGLGAASPALQLLEDLGLKGLAAAVSSVAATASATTTEQQPPRTAAPGGLRVSVSRMQVHFSRSGRVQTERVDMRLQSAAADCRADEGLQALQLGRTEVGGGGGVRLALWGSADLKRDTLAFTAGVAPGPLLLALGLPREGLPEDYLLMVPMRGAVSAPKYDVAAAVVRLGQLAARQKAAQWQERREERRERGEVREGLLAGGLQVLMNAVKPSQEVVDAVDRLIQQDMAAIPPPTATSLPLGLSRPACPDGGT